MELPVTEIGKTTGVQSSICEHAGTEITIRCENGCVKVIVSCQSVMFRWEI